MAQAEKAIRERVVTEEVEVVALELTPREAETLATVLRRIGGHPQTTRRGEIDAITVALMDAGVQYDQREVDSMTGYLYFSETQ